MIPLPPSSCPPAGGGGAGAPGHTPGVPALGAKRIRLSRGRGWRLPEGAVVVSRPSKWGNPFVVGRDGTRLQVTAMFATLASGFIAIVGPPEPEEQLALWKRLRGRSIAALKGRDLACWCPLDGPCHADILLHLANGTRLPVWLVGREIEMPRVRLGMDARQFDRLLKKAAAKRAEEAAAAAQAEESTSAPLVASAPPPRMI